MTKFEHLECDLNVAAFLVVRGFRLLGVEPAGGKRLSFRFEDDQGNARAAALEYFSGATVSARDFAAAEKNLKTVIYSARNGNGKQYRNR